MLSVAIQSDEGLPATGYHVAGLAGRSGRCNRSAIFSLFSAGVCLRQIQGQTAHCSSD